MKKTGQKEVTIQIEMRCARRGGESHGNSVPAIRGEGGGKN